MISVVSWAAGPTSAPVIPKTFHNPGTAFSGGGGGGGGAVYGSTYFDGTGDALNLGQIDGTPLELSALTNFTLEGWWKASTSMSLSSNNWNALISMPWHGQSNVNSQIWVGWAGSAYGAWNVSAGEFYIGLYMSDGTFETLNSSNTTIYNDNAWHHFALVKNGTSYSLFVDGTRTEEITTSKTLNTNLGGKIGYIGGYNATSSAGEVFNFNGYVSNVRVSNTARYSGTSVALPNSPFTSDANTLFLTCQNGSGAITDASSNNRTITAVGDAIADPKNPFGSTSSSGYGSAYFDGTGDYLTTATDTDLIIGTNDFTIEFWVYLNSFSGYPIIFDRRASSANNQVLETQTNGKFRWYSGGSFRIESDTAITTGSWNHIAIVRESGTTKMMLNELYQSTTYSDSTNYSGSSVILGKHYTNASGYVDGYISNYREVIGTALYQTANTGGSTYFDGTDDHIKVADNTGFRLGTGDFTIEMWVNFTTTSLEGGSNRRIFVLHEGGNAVDNLQICVDDGSYRTNGDLFLYSNSNQGYLDTDIRSGWHHIAVVRNSGTLDFYLDGVSKYSASNTQDYSPGGAGGPRPIFGQRGDDKGDYLGYISNFRMVVGTAVYTSNFTPSTSALTDITNTQLLTCQNSTGAITDNSSYSHSLSVHGNTQADTTHPFSNYYSIPTIPLTAISNTRLLTCQNSTGAITDASGSVISITASGDAQADTFNPFQTTTYGSVVFDGGQDYLRFPNSGTSNDLVIGTNDFTLEFWIKADSFSNGGVIYDTRSGHATSLMINFNTSGNLRLYANSGYRITADGISTDVWTHYAIVRDSGTTKLFLNGIQDTETYSDTNNYTGDTVFIGRHQSGVNVADFDGYISNLRLVVGTALYPPAPLGNAGGTPQGTGSCFFDGANDHIELVSQDNPGTRYLDNAANFTVEAWAYFTDPQPTDENNIFEFSTGDRIIFGRRKQASGRTCMYMYSAATSDLFVDNAAHNIPSYQWVHLAWVKQGTNMRMYKNGVNVVGNNNNSATNMPANMDAAVIHIGENYDGNEPMKGYLSNVRYSTTARYTSDFDVPTGPFENDSDTKLIICHRGDQIQDIIGRGSPTANGGVSASYSSPFLESTTPLTAITNTKLLTCNKDSGAITDESSIGHTVHVNSNAQSSTENPF